MKIQISIHTQTNKLKKITQKLPVLVGTNMFAAFLGLLAIAILIAALVFYRYAFSIQPVSVDIQISQTIFEDQTLVEILEEIDTRKVLFDAVDSKTYPNIFTPPLVAPSEP
ncbi:hypothetical protein IID24_01750 [Patescibacteria group bacterium]|nr:hypothetical protein [Patescibacteria group bacterium]